MNSWLVISVVGLGVGVLYGLFGVGSSFATPALSLIGVTGMGAIVGPLPAMLPGSATSAWTYARQDRVDWWVAKRTLLGALPAAVLGAALSPLVGSSSLVILSGVVLLGVGIRVLSPSTKQASDGWAHDHAALLIASATGIGFFSGLLANGGGFLLVPLFLLAVGLDMGMATGTSLVVATALTIPTLATHLVIGDLNWAVAGCFMLGMVPGSHAGAVLSNRLSSARLRTAFGILLVIFAVWFLLRRLLG